MSQDLLIFSQYGKELHRKSRETSVFGGCVQSKLTFFFPIIMREECLKCQKLGSLRPAEDSWNRHSSDGHILYWGALRALLFSWLAFYVERVQQDRASVCFYLCDLLISAAEVWCVSLSTGGSATIMIHMAWNLNLQWWISRGKILCISGHSVCFNTGWT